MTGYGTDVQLRNSDLLLLKTTVRSLSNFLVPIVVVDRQPLSSNSIFQAGNAGIKLIDMDAILSGDFSSKPNCLRKVKAGAEVLAHNEVPLSAIEEIICSDAESNLRDMVAAANISTLSVRRSSKHFFARGS